MRKLVALIIGMGVAVLANADVLYWQVNDTDLDDAYKAYKTASIVVTTDKGENRTPLENYMIGESESLGTSLAKDYFSMAGFYADAGADAAGKMFAIELYDASGVAIANSGWVDYSSLSSYVSASEFNSNWKTMTSGYGTGATWYAGAAPTPEPTSGLLFLVGAALVGLRRRKVVA